MLNWEEISNSSCTDVFRAPVFGGWLVMSVDNTQTQFPEQWGPSLVSFRNDTGYEWKSSVTFIPDAKHEWDLEKEYGTQPS